MMAASELVFERFAGALEGASTHGTAVAAPTHIFNGMGMINPEQTRSRRSRSDGTLDEFYSSVVTQQRATWTLEGDLDVNTLPFLLEMGAKGGGVIATPGGGTLSRTHTYLPTDTSDNLLSSTLFWGDPGWGTGKVFQTPYSMLDELTITSDTNSTDSSTMSASGTSQFPIKLTAPTIPALTAGGLIIGQWLNLWMDTSSAIGTTAITGRVISATHTLTNNISYKPLATGAGGSLSFTRHGRGKRHMETTIVFELADETQYDLFVAGTVTKTRVTHNGPLIEGSIYSSVMIDTYGPLDALAWGDFQGTNRTVAFTIQSERNTALGASWQIVVTNAIATI
jgi:hypothetical protein